MDFFSLLSRLAAGAFPLSFTSSTFHLPSPVVLPSHPNLLSNFSSPPLPFSLFRLPLHPSPALFLSCSLPPLLFFCFSPLSSPSSSLSLPTSLSLHFPTSFSSSRPTSLSTSRPTSLSLYISTYFSLYISTSLSLSLHLDLPLSLYISTSLSTSPRFLTKREQQLLQRRHHAAELLQWKQRLDQEEAEVRRMEKEALGVWDRQAHHQAQVQVQPGRRSPEPGQRETSDVSTSSGCRQNQEPLSTEKKGDSSSDLN